MIWKIVKKVGVGLGVFMAMVVVYLLIALICSHITILGEADNRRGEKEIYLLTNGVHTDIVMPIKTDVIDWSQVFPFEDTVSKDTIQCFVSIGWGDKDFYMEVPEWSDLTPEIAVRAVLGLGSSALHVTYYKRMSEDRDCVKIPVSNRQYQRLVKYILETRQTDTNRNSLHIETSACYGFNDSFYEARRRYSLYYTCNTWANNALKYSGQKAALWTLHYGGIFCHYR